MRIPARRFITSTCKEAARRVPSPRSSNWTLPGTGKTLVGLQLDMTFLEDLAVDRWRQAYRPAVVSIGQRPSRRSSPVRTSIGRRRRQEPSFAPSRRMFRRIPDVPSAVPPEHVLIFDEAQTGIRRRAGSGNASRRDLSMTSPSPIISSSSRNESPSGVSSLVSLARPGNPFGRSWRRPMGAAIERRRTREPGRSTARRVSSQ